MSVDHVWSDREVVDVSGPEFAARTYIEQAEVRRYLSAATKRTNLNRIADVGAGYGRLCPVLREACDEVVAFERDAGFVAKGSFLHPTVEYRKVESLGNLPAEDNEFDFAVTFTVLQHLSHEDARTALAEIRRVVRPGGFVLLCEEAEPRLIEGDLARGDTYFTFGRDVEQYKTWLVPFRLLETSPRIIERGYPRSNVGQYLFFRAESEVETVKDADG